jgi:hypothetical protein
LSRNVKICSRPFRDGLDRRRVGSCGGGNRPVSRRHKHAASPGMVDSYDHRLTPGLALAYPRPRACKPAGRCVSWRLGIERPARVNQDTDCQHVNVPPR